MSAPDRIAMNMQPEYLERYGQTFVTNGHLYDHPDYSRYLLATPAREKAEELVEALQRWLDMQEGDDDRELRQRTSALLASLEPKP
jgi:hypothetical protein